MSTKGLQEWVDKLRNQDMPVVGNVIAELNAITGCKDSDVNQMAEVILRDPNLTSHVLRIANSVQYNYSKQQVTTVSRAVVMIGFKGMRALCISLLVVDSLLQGEPKERLLKLIAQGFHAATQARNLVKTTDSASSEEVFIAALLFNLGEMAFWSLENIDGANALLMSEDPHERKAAMERVLGTSFKAISRELAKTWRLGETLEQALYPPQNPVPKVQAVVIGERLARAALYGWDSPQVKKVLQEVMKYTDSNLEAAAQMVKSAADQAAEVALSYGVSAACPHIPNSLTEMHELQHVRPTKVMKGDVHLQLNILRELSNAARDSLDVNTIFQMVLEGMHRGIGLERVCIAFIKNHKLKAKYVLGDHTEHWRSQFVFDVGPYSDNIFVHTMETGEAQWFTSDTINAQEDWYSPDFVRIIGKLPCYTYSLQIDQRKVAVFYADRWTFGGKLDQERFESFSHFATQAQISLNLLAPKNPDWV